MSVKRFMQCISAVLILEFVWTYRDCNNKRYLKIRDGLLTSESRDTFYYPNAVMQCASACLAKKLFAFFFISKSGKCSFASSRTRRVWDVYSKTTWPLRLLREPDRNISNATGRSHRGTDQANNSSDNQTNAKILDKTSWHPTTISYNNFPPVTSKTELGENRKITKGLSELTVTSEMISKTRMQSIYPATSSPMHLSPSLVSDKINRNHHKRNHKNTTVKRHCPRRDYKLQRYSRKKNGKKDTRHVRPTCLKFHEERHVSFQEAARRCRKEKARLVVANTMMKFKLVKQYMKYTAAGLGTRLRNLFSQPAWIDFKGKKWLDGSKLTDPQFKDKKAKCVPVTLLGKLYVRYESCDTKNLFICQMPI